MTDVLCPNCGRPNSSQREFCDFCGDPLDGALPVEDMRPSSKDDFLDSQPTGDMDEASRLDSLMGAFEEAPSPSNVDDFQTEEPLNGDSRLESIFADQDDPSLNRADQPETPDEESLNGGSRLDDYLPAEKSSQEQESKPTQEDDASRLEDYISPTGTAADLPLDLESLSNQTEDEASRLDNYLGAENPPEPTEEDESFQLDDFLTDESPPDSSQQDEISRLDDFSADENPQEPSQQDEISRLEDFSADESLPDSSQQDEISRLDNFLADESPPEPVSYTHLTLPTN